MNSSCVHNECAKRNLEKIVHHEKSRFLESLAVVTRDRSSSPWQLGHPAKMGRMATLVHTVKSQSYYSDLSATQLFLLMRQNILKKCKNICKIYFLFLFKSCAANDFKALFYRWFSTNRHCAKQIGYHIVWCFLLTVLN